MHSVRQSVLRQPSLRHSKDLRCMVAVLTHSRVCVCVLLAVCCPIALSGRLTLSRWICERQIYSVRHIICPYSRSANIHIYAIDPLRHDLVATSSISVPLYLSVCCVCVGFSSDCYHVEVIFVSDLSLYLLIALSRYAI